MIDRMQILRYKVRLLVFAAEPFNTITRNWVSVFIFVLFGRTAVLR